MPPTPKKRVRPLSSAILRGKRSAYDFQVYPLDAEFEKSAAVYVISRRVTDKRGKGHLQFVWVGQSESLADDVRKRRREKCVKRTRANAVCLLKEPDPERRGVITEDLREAHSIVCDHP